MDACDSGVNFMNVRKRFLAMMLAASCSGLSWPIIVNGGQEFLVEQKDKAFVHKGARVANIKVKVGDVIEFKNLDPYFHNVFSLSDVKIFDLGSYPQGHSKSVKFDKRGKVEVECAIHPEMHMIVEVE
jgi:plastocyanin